MPVIIVAGVPHNDGVSRLRQCDDNTIMFHDLIGLCNSIAPVLAGWLYRKAVGPNSKIVYCMFIYERNISN